MRQYCADSFKQQQLDHSQQFKIFAFGIVSRFDDLETVMGMYSQLQFKYMDAEDEISKLKFHNILYDDSVEAHDVDPASILKHPLQMKEELFSTHSIEETGTERHADPLVQKM